MTLFIVIIEVLIILITVLDKRCSFREIHRAKANFIYICGLALQLKATKI